MSKKRSKNRSRGSNGPPDQAAPGPAPLTSPHVAATAAYVHEPTAAPDRAPSNEGLHPGADEPKRASRPAFFEVPEPSPAPADAEAQSAAPCAADLTDGKPGTSSSTLRNFQPISAEQMSAIASSPLLSAAAEAGSAPQTEPTSQDSGNFQAAVSERAQSWPPEEAAARPELPGRRELEAEEQRPAENRAVPVSREHQPAATEQPERKAGLDRKPNKATKGKSEGHKLSELSDRDDSSPVHHAFFLEGEEVSKQHLEAHAKLVEEARHSEPGPTRHSIPLTPEQITRRRKLRRVVSAIVVGAVGLLTIGALKIAQQRSESAPDGSLGASATMGAAKASAPPPRPTELVSASVRPLAAPMLARGEPSAVASGVASALPSAAPPEIASVAASGSPPASASAVASASTVPEGVDPKKEALRLLNRGKFKDVIPMAEAAIERDPEDAEPYLFLGTALQSTGKWKEGVDAYSRCVHTAKRGPVAECRAVGGH